MHFPKSCGIHPFPSVSPAVQILCEVPDVLLGAEVLVITIKEISLVVENEAVICHGRCNQKEQFKLKAHLKENSTCNE